MVSRLILLSLLGAACFAATYTIQTVAGANNAGDGGSALSAALVQPEGIAVDASGNVYVSDAAGNRVRMIAPDGSIQTVAGTGVAGFAGDGGPSAAAELNQPYGLAFDSTGNLYIADLGNARVRKVTMDGMIQTVAGGGAFAATSQGQGGPATSAQLMRAPQRDARSPAALCTFPISALTRSTTSLAMERSHSWPGPECPASRATARPHCWRNSTRPPVSPSTLLESSTSRTARNNCVRKVYNGVIMTVFNTPGPTGLALGSTGALYIAASSYVGTVSQQTPGISSAFDVAVDHAGDLFATSGGFVLGDSGRRSGDDHCR